MIIFWQYDFPSILLAVLSALVCTLVGNVLIVRKQSLMADAISHVVLPGIVLGYVVAGQASSVYSMTGATLAAVISVILIELIKRITRVDYGTACGVVLVSMFALGVVLLEVTNLRSVHLDVQHALNGNMESAVWIYGKSFSDLFVWSKVSYLPASIWRLVSILCALSVLFFIFYKEIILLSFDEGYGIASGMPTGVMSICLVVAVALACVASFDAVGSILVVAMIVCPSAAARVLTVKFSTQLVLSLIFATFSGIAGYFLSVYLPEFLGFKNSLSSSGMVAVVAGIIQVFAMLLSSTSIFRGKKHSTVTASNT